MKEQEVDVAVIGAGTAGLSAYRQASQHADRVVLIEGGQHGTTCARVGCMPSKLLIVAAEAAHDARHAARFGVHVGDVRIDGRQVMARVRSERDRFVGFVLSSVARIPDRDKLEGTARFVDPHVLEVGGRVQLRAGRIVIATGSRPHVVPMLKDAGKRLITSDDVFEWTDLPASVAVFGPGVIGLELGQALARLGVRIRMFGLGGAVGPIQDPRIREIALNTFNEEFPLDPDAKVHAIRHADDGVEIRFDDAQGQPRSETFDYLLATTGRRPNIDDMGLQHCGLELDARGMPAFDRYTMQCGRSHIFIAGDANNEIPLLHEAADQGRIAGMNAGRFPEVRAGLRRTPLAVMFTEPQVATAGLTLQQTAMSCKSGFAVGSVDFENQGRSRVMGKNRGLLRVYGEHGSGRFMGAEMFGPAAEHIGHLLAWSAQKGLTVAEMLDMPFYHPVIEEGLRTALRDLNHQLKLGPGGPEHSLDCGPGG